MFYLTLEDKKPAFSQGEERVIGLACTSLDFLIHVLGAGAGTAKTSQTRMNASFCYFRFRLWMQIWMNK